MSKNDVSTYAGTTIMLTFEGRLALAADALAAAVKTRSKQGRKRLCEKAMNHLRSAPQFDDSKSMNGNARSSVESNDSRVPHFTTPFSV
jgi:hypothetical protein